MIAAAYPSVARLLRSPRTWTWSVAWASVALFGAGHARLRGWPHGATEALLGAYAMLALPLLAYVLVRGSVGPGSFARSIRPLVRLGAAPWKAAAATACVAILACTLSGAALASAIAVVAHGASDPPVLRDALTSAFAGGVGAMAYGAMFVASTRLGGLGPAAYLVLDWVLGAGSGGASMGTPRAHLRNLLGGLAPMGIAGRTSAVALGVIAAIGLGLAVIRRR
ncbi:MAG: hypothetical protein ABTD50_07050 [Polyangiaceae bacterium]